MTDMNAERFAQRAYDVGLLDNQQLSAFWSELGSREKPLADAVAVMIRREFLTNFQVDRILKGERIGYFYGKYRVLYLVGAGTFARVYRAVHEETGKVHAVKVLRKRYRDNLVELEQFLREGRVGLQLRHPNVVPIYEIEGDPRNPYMVMEFVEGQTLRDMVRIRRTLEVPVALSLLTDVVAGLCYAGEKGITHRDLKMSNVLVSSAGRAKLVDFGLAAAAGRTEGELADCPNARAIDYAALERGTGVRKDDIRSDLYFAGCLMYNMLTGQSPLTETKDRLQRLNINRFGNIRPLSELAPDVPYPVAALVNRSMEFDPTKRFQHPSEMLAECKGVARRLESGEFSDSSSASGAGDGTSGAAPTPPKMDVLEGAGRTVLVIESKIEMQDVFREQLKKRGYRVLIMGDPQRAVHRLLDDPRVAEAVVVSAPDLGAAAINAFRELGAAPTLAGLPGVLLIDEGQKSLVRASDIGDRRLLLLMPLKVRMLRAALLKVLGQPALKE